MVKKSSTDYFHFWCETSIISLFHLLVIGYIPCSVCHGPQTPFLTIYNGKQFSQFSIFLDVSESDNSISWSLHSLGDVQRWCSFPFRLSPDYVWTHRKLFVTSNMRIMFTWIKSWWQICSVIQMCILHQVGT